MSSFANLMKYWKCVDGMLKEELGELYTNILRFFEASFGRISGLDSTAVGSWYSGSTSYDGGT
ncbi:predicted protein [Coccidioides posadasii str. Silveira]|uniref:Predicted protein n=1 Tax=Coccidioides posadasii (strain RMSCC 757 / Silveira) TaxID=443226 RepID=E9CSB5_COCPS|nr:predicted protein [Coccidioides posadasii str. Silveira]